MGRLTLRLQLAVAVAIAFPAIMALAPARGLAAPTCTTSWQGGAGSWSADRWSNGVPGPDDTACIADGVVTHDAGTDAVRFVVVGAGGGLRVTGGRLELGRAVDSPDASTLGEAAVQGGTLVVAGTAVGGSMTLATGGLEVPGTLFASELLASGGRLDVAGALQADVQLTAAVPFALGGRLDGTVGVGAGVSQAIDGDGVLAAAALVDGSLQLAGTLDLAFDEVRLGDGAAIAGTSTPTAAVAVTKGSGAGIATYGLSGRLGPVDAAGGELRLGAAHSEAQFEGGIRAAGGAVVRLADELLVGHLPWLTLTDGGRVLTAGDGNALAQLQSVDVLWLREAQLTTTPALRLDAYAVLEHGGRIEATGGVDVPAGSRIELHLGPSRVVGALRFAAGSTLIAVAGAPSGTALLDVTGAARFAGRLQLVHDDDLPAQLGEVYTLVSYGSSAGTFDAVEDVVASGSPWPRLTPEYGSGLLRVRAQAVSPPVVDDAAVGSVTPTSAVITAVVSAGAGGGSTWLTLSGPGADLQSGVIPLDADALYDVEWEIAGLTPATTYVARVTATAVAGTAQSPALSFTTGSVAGGAGGSSAAPPDPAEPSGPATPVMTPTVTPLRPVRAPGPRVFVLAPAGRSAFRVTVAYALRRDCRTPCRATVELLLRTGKVLFAAGDGKRLARGTVRLRRGANTLRLRIPRAALRGQRWRPAGRRFQTLRVRLRVTLPQADGRRLLTVRDGVLRRRR